MAYQPTPQDDSPPPSFEQSRLKDGSIPQRAASSDVVRKPMSGYGERVRAAEEYAMGDLEDEGYGRQSIHGSSPLLESHPYGLHLIS
jgi:hypothetical protein